MKDTDRVINAVMAAAKDSYHGIGTPGHPGTKIEDGVLHISNKSMNPMKDVPGYIFLYCGPSPDMDDFRGLAAYYLKKAEYFSGEDGEFKQLRLDADHHVYACFFPRDKKTGEVVKARGMLRLKGRAAEEAFLGFDEIIRANNPEEE